MALKPISTNPISSHTQIPKSDHGLRPYQVEAKQKIYDAWDEVNDVMFQMPTGTGKTVLFASIINELDMFFRLKGGRPLRILIIAHRDELIEQISSHLKRRCVHHGIIKGGHKKEYNFQVQVGSINTVTHAAREAEIRKLAFDYIIIDEAHHSNAASYQKLWDYFPNSKKLGVTATPYRLDGKGLCDLYEKLILSQSVKDFIAQGYLSPYKYYSVPPSAEEKEALRSIKKFVAGDYDATELEKKFDTGRIRARLYDAYQQYAYGKKGIIYAIKVAHGNHICEEYCSHGIRAVSISAKTSLTQRKEYVRKFKEGEIDIIVNVDIFSEGFDCPDIEFIQLARPTQSLSKYLQQVGRGLRPTENKSECIILDNVGMYEHFGLPDANRKWHYHFMGKETKDSPNMGLGIGNELGGHQERDTSEGTESMMLIQGAEPKEDMNKTLGDLIYLNSKDSSEEETTHPPFVMPNIDKMEFGDFLGAIGYPVQNVAFLRYGKIYDYIITADFKIVIYEVPVNESELKDAYEWAYLFDDYGGNPFPMSTPFDDYWMNCEHNVVAEIGTDSLLFAHLLKRKIPISNIRTNYNGCCIIEAKTTDADKPSAFFNAHGQFWTGGKEADENAEFFYVRPSFGTKDEYPNCTISSATDYHKLGIVLVRCGGRNYDDYVAIQKHSDLGRLINKTRESSKFFYLLNVDKKLIYMDSKTDGALYFSEDGVKLDNESPNSDRVIRESRKLEADFINRIKKSGGVKKTLQQLRKVLPCMCLDNFEHSNEDYFYALVESKNSDLHEDVQDVVANESVADETPNEPHISEKAVTDEAAQELPPPIEIVDFGSNICHIVKQGEELRLEYKIPKQGDPCPISELRKEQFLSFGRSTVVIVINDKEYLIKKKGWKHPYEIIKRVGNRYVYSVGNGFRYAVKESTAEYCYISFRSGCMRAYTSKSHYILYDEHLEFVREYVDGSYKGEGYMHDGKRIRFRYQS